MQVFRRVLFWCHLVVGVIAGLVIFLMSVTGVLLTYEKQMRAWADARSYEVAAPAPGAPRLGVEALLARVQAAEPGTPTTVRVRQSPSAAAEVAFGREKTLFVDPYSGQVLGEDSKGVRRFFTVVTDWHRWLGRAGESRAWGRAITGAANLGFLFLVMSGFYLWWPPSWNRRAFRNILWFRRGLRPKARDFNWHNVAGFWMLIPLFIIVLSGVVISYPWAGNAVYRLFGETPPPRPAAQGAGPQGGAGARGAGEAGRGRAAEPRAAGVAGQAGRDRGAAPAGAGAAGGPGRGRVAGAEGARGGGRGGEAVSLAGLDAAWARAMGHAPGWRTIQMQVPTAPDGPVTFNIDRGTGGQPQKQAELKVERGTGRVAEWTTFPDRTPGRRTRSILRFAHTGEVLGLTGQTLAGIASFAAALLAFTGISLALRRFGAWTRRRRDPSPSS